MQMQSVQGTVDKIEFGGMMTINGQSVLMFARTPPRDLTLAKELLWTLYRTDPCGWEVDLQDDTITIWSALHESYAYRMRRSQLMKGLGNVPKIARELVARIRAGYTPRVK